MGADGSECDGGMSPAHSVSSDDLFGMVGHNIKEEGEHSDPDHSDLDSDSSPGAAGDPRMLVQVLVQRDGE